MRISEHLSNHIRPFVDENGMPLSNVVFDIKTFINSQGGQYFIALMELWIQGNLRDQLKPAFVPYVNPQSGIIISVADQEKHQRHLLSEMAGIERCLSYLFTAVEERTATYAEDETRVD